MNIIRMTGGIGNQMFAYALYLKFKSLGIEACIDDFSEYEDHDNARPLRLDIFDITYPRVSRDLYNEYTDSRMDIISRIRRKIFGRRPKSYTEESLNFDENLLKQDGKYLIGYYQSEKYFEDISEQVIRAFSFNNDTKLKSAKFLQTNGLTDFLETNPQSASVLKPNTVSIHIRRGDYLELPDTYGEVCNEEYLDKSIKHMMEKVENPQFIVFTNDDEWTKEWADRYMAANPECKDRLHIFSGTTEDTGYLDLYIMSQCGHHIIANSSFSWWGAYLGENPGKIIVAPKVWNRAKEQTDIYTEDMVLM